MFGLLLLLTITVHQPLIGLTALTPKALKGESHETCVLFVRQLEDEREVQHRAENNFKLVYDNTPALFSSQELLGLFLRC
jgi:hypothetical protein